MNKSTTIFCLLIFFGVAPLVYGANYTQSGSQTPAQKKTGNITYVNIGIHQPNVQDCYVMAMLEFDSELDSKWIDVFPNPNPGQFTLEVTLRNSDSALFIHMYDLAGKMVYESREMPGSNNFRKNIDVSNLQKGVYFIRITVKDRVGVKQIIIY